MSINFWDLLHQRQDELTKSGRAVADYLLQHADEAQYLSISSLAKECNVAEATVFRFCRALGFEGYHEMRIALAQANATGSMVNHQELQPGATTATLCDHAHALFMTAINGTQNALSTEAVDEIDRIEAGLAADELHPNKVKRALARNIVAAYYDDVAAEAAEADFDLKFKEHGFPADAPIFAPDLTPDESGLVYVAKILVDAGVAGTASEARRLIDGGGVKVNGEALAPKAYNVAPEVLAGAEVQVGKKKFVRFE